MGEAKTTNVIRYGVLGPRGQFHKCQECYLNQIGLEGLEPPTGGLEIRCSVQLSYSPTCLHSPSALLLNNIKPLDHFESSFS
jgi:hypothetical protein